MFIQLDQSTATYSIKDYEPGKIWVNDQCYASSVIIYSERLIVPWAPRQLAELTAAHFAPLFAYPLPEILILGTGTTCQIPPEALLVPFFEKGVGVEFMKSKSACFTFSALAAEKRKVAACILIV